MTSTTLRSGAPVRLLAAAWTGLLGFLVNPFGWRGHTAFALRGTAYSPMIPLPWGLCLEETCEKVSADILLETDRVGRRRVRILNLNGVTRRQVQKTPEFVRAAQWTVTGDDTILG